jgi:hypothetical protein
VRETKKPARGKSYDDDDDVGVQISLLSPPPLRCYEGASPLPDLHFVVPGDPVGPRLHKERLRSVIIAEPRLPNRVAHTTSRNYACVYEASRVPYDISGNHFLL